MQHEVPTERVFVKGKGQKEGKGVLLRENFSHPIRFGEKGNIICMCTRMHAMLVLRFKQRVSLQTV